MLIVVFAFLFVEAEKGLGYADGRPNFLTRKVILPSRFGVAEDRGSSRRVLRLIGSPVY